MSKSLDVCLLLDYYADLLTDKQRDLAELYYNQDLSLAEIAELTGITRQGVHDSVRRTELILRNYERNVGLVAKTHDMLTRMKQIRSLTLQLQQQGSNPQATQQLQQIQQIANAFIEQQGE